jgi:hypothetical protein
MRIFKMKSYYACPNNNCIGEMSVDLKTQSYGIAPCLYNYVCNVCGHRKTMACQDELKELVKTYELV